MRKSGVKGLGRLLSVLMVAALLMTTAMVPALALDRWEDVVVSVIWTDSQGQQQTTQAFPVPDSAEHAYWATLDASALFSTVQVQVVSSDPAYTFYLKDYASEIMWTQDATALDPMYSYEVDYYCNSVYEGMFPLYLSSQGMPETPAQESVNVPVYYVTEDGQQLDFQYASCLTNATTQVYANSSVVPWDYLLVKPASGVVDVFVDSMGNASPSEVRFVYAVPEQPTEAPTEPPVIQAEVTVLYQLDDNGTILDTQYVTLNQGDNILESRSARRLGFDSAVYLNTRGDICETTNANLFFVRDGRLYTPDERCGLLPGTVRAWLCERYEAEQGTFRQDSLDSWDEVFATNALMGVRPVVELGDAGYGIGPVTRAIQREYRRLELGIL